MTAKENCADGAEIYMLIPKVDEAMSDFAYSFGCVPAESGKVAQGFGQLCRLWIIAY